MRLRRSVVVVMLAASLAFATVPAHSYSHSRVDVVPRGVGSKAAGEVALAILGITTGVVLLVGGAVWYYIHHRRTRAIPAATAPPAGTETESSPN